MSNYTSITHFLEAYRLLDSQARLILGSHNPGCSRPSQAPPRFVISRALQLLHAVGLFETLHSPLRVEAYDSDENLNAVVLIERCAR